jgi:molecular chaperone GrpE
MIDEEVRLMKETDMAIEKEQDPTDPANGAEPLVHLDPASVTAEQFEELKERAAKADEHWDRLLRTTADFDNFKKRAAREKQDATRYANESLLQKLIPILDNLEMAQSAAQAAQTDAAQSLQTGVNMIHQQLKNALSEAGLEELDATGKTFDPNFHEAVSQQETNAVPEGQVVQQLRRGYKFRDRLLRPASVVVSKKPGA